jgi:hypothetical protein
MVKQLHFAIFATLACLTVCGTVGLAQNTPAKTVEQEDAERIAVLVLANHILADQGVLDGFGHVSVPSAKNPDHYFISRSRAAALVSAAEYHGIRL